MKPIAAQSTDMLRKMLIKMKWNRTAGVPIAQDGIERIERELALREQRAEKEFIDKGRN